MTPGSDAEILARWRAQRDEAAFRTLCARHAATVRATCLRLRAEDADAATQAVFILLAQRPEAVGDPNCLVGWLMGAARRVVANQRRGEERRRKREQEVAMEMARQRLDPGDPTWAEVRPLLDEALASLGPARREAVVRFYLEGRPQAEVAAQLGCSVAAVKTRVHEGLGQLRQWFARHGLRLGGVALASGLGSELVAADHALAATCAQAAFAPASAPAAAALAKGVAGGGTLASAATVAIGAVLAVGLAAGLAIALTRTTPVAVMAPAAGVAWFGNAPSTGTASAPAGWLPRDIADLVVADGRIHTVSGWDGHRGAAAIITTAGEVVGAPAMDAYFGAQWSAWAGSGGTTLASDREHVYYAACLRGGDGRDYAGIARYTRDGAAAGWPGARDGNHLALAIGTRTMPSGLAVADGVLFASDPTGQRILRIDTATMTVTGGFACADPGRLAIDGTPARDLWVIDTRANRVRRLGRDGSDRGVAITDCAKPVALCVDLRSGDLLVADGDPARQRIRRYDVATGAHRPGMDLGEPVSAGPVPGRVGPGRFLRITGIQTDAEGGLYVASWDYGARLRKFDGERSLVWARQASEFVSCADLDPDDDSALFSAGHRYVIDPDRAAGQGWTDAAITLDPLRCPDDPRLRQPWLATRMLRIAGQPIMVGKEQMGADLFLWRFEGETAIPAAMYWPNGSDDPAYPPGHPQGPFLWSDDDGDGRMRASEYRAPPSGVDIAGPYGHATTIDDHGGIWVNRHGWEAGTGTIARLECRGLNRFGVPTWSTTPDREHPIPAGTGITRLSKLAYDAAHDRMYLGVWTAERPHPGYGWEQMEVGGELQRFDAWSTAPAHAWSCPLMPAGGTDRSKRWASPKAWSFENEYAFLTTTWRDREPGAVVIRLADGEPVARIGGASAGIDMNDGIQSHRRRDGGYLVLLEDDRDARGVWMRWRPGDRPLQR